MPVKHIGKLAGEEGGRALTECHHVPTPSRNSQAQGRSCTDEHWVLAHTSRKQHQQSSVKIR